MSPTKNNGRYWSNRRNPGYEQESGCHDYQFHDAPDYPVELQIEMAMSSARAISAIGEMFHDHQLLIQEAWDCHYFEHHDPEMQNYKCQMREGDYQYERRVEMAEERVKELEQELVEAKAKLQTEEDCLGKPSNSYGGQNHDT